MSVADFNSLRTGDTVLVRARVKEMYDAPSGPVQLAFNDKARDTLWVTRDQLASVEPRVLAVGDKVQDGIGTFGTILAISGRYAWVERKCGEHEIYDLRSLRLL